VGKGNNSRGVIKVIKYNKKSSNESDQMEWRLLVDTFFSKWANSSGYSQEVNSRDFLDEFSWAYFW
jgi:hypothetical protein